MSKTEKPYYLRQPWDVLFRENKLEKASPWSIDLVLLLATLLEEMEKVGIDFRLAGTAIQSSVLIYLRKAEMLMMMQELPRIEEGREDVYLPPALPLPFRFEHTTTTVTDLIEALEKALTERSGSLRPKLPMLPAPIPDFLEAEQYLLEIEGRSDDLYEELRWRQGRAGPVRLTELVRGQEWLEVIRIFMMLLFLAQRLKIELSQDEDEMDVVITVPEAAA